MSRRRDARSAQRAAWPSARPSTDDCPRCGGDGYVFDERLLRRRCACVWAALSQAHARRNRHIKQKTTT